MRSLLQTYQNFIIEAEFGPYRDNPNSEALKFHKA